MRNPEEDELEKMILGLSSLPNPPTNMNDISKLLEIAKFDPNPLKRLGALKYLSLINIPEVLQFLSQIRKNDKDIAVRENALSFIVRLRTSQKALSHSVSIDFLSNLFTKQPDNRFNNLKAEFAKALEASMDLSEEISQILQDSDQDFTTDSLWNNLSTRFTWEEYSQTLAHLQKTGKLYIESDGYLTWLWSPELFEKFSKNELILK